MPEGSEGWIALLLAVGGWLYTTILFLWRRRSEQEDVRAAERRGRLEERFERVRTYAIGLQEFVEAGVAVVRVRQGRPVVHRENGSTERVRRALEREWDKVVAVEPRPGALVFVRDTDAQERLLRLRVWAQQCRERCLECLGSGEVMGEEEATDMVEFAREQVAQILEWMEEAVRQGER